MTAQPNPHCRPALTTAEKKAVRTACADLRNQLRTRSRTTVLRVAGTDIEVQAIKVRGRFNYITHYNFKRDGLGVRIFKRKCTAWALSYAPRTTVGEFIDTISELMQRGAWEQV